jgi:hypothetical protein
MGFRVQGSESLCMGDLQEKRVLEPLYMDVSQKKQAQEIGSHTSKHSGFS